MAVYAATLLACFLYLAAAYPSGAPDSACDTFRPSHLHHSSRRPYKAQNEDDRGQLDNSECPYNVTYSSKFTPGETITSRLVCDLYVLPPGDVKLHIARVFSLDSVRLQEQLNSEFIGSPEELQITIRAKDSGNYFQGYILSVVKDDDDFVDVQGQFGSSSNKICGGAAVTHTNNTHKTSEEIQWTAPADGSGKRFEIWMTVVKSFSRYWMSCSPTTLPAIDAAELLSTNPGTFELPTEDVPDTNSPSIFGNPDHSNENNNDKNGHNNDNDHSHDKMNNKDDMSSSSMIESEEDPDSEGQDESGNSIENSVDVSDNRSGSSLNSEEKEQKRKQYFDEGIENFDKDIDKILVATNKKSLYQQFKSGTLSGASAVNAFTALITVAIGMLTLA